MEKTNDEAMVNSRVKLMCSYGGKIQPRLSNTNQLSYHGGDTKILTVDRSIRFSDIVAKLSSLCGIAGEFCVKYQLPGHDLDALVSLLDDDDVDHMMFEYDHLLKDSTRAARIRLFLFGLRKEPEKPPGSGLGFPVNPDYLFGFDKEFQSVSNSVPGMDIPPALDLLQIPGIIVPGFSGSSNDEANGARDGHVSAGPYVYRLPGAQGGYYAVPGVQPVYGILPGTASVQDPNMMMMMKSSMIMGVNKQLSEEIKFSHKNA